MEKQFITLENLSLADKDFAIYKEQLDITFQQSKNAFLGQPLSAGFASIILLSYGIPATPVFTAFFLFILLQILRYLFTLQYEREHPDNLSNLQMWAQIHIFGTVINASMWSIGLYFFSELSPNFDSISYIFIVIITILAATVSYIAYRPGYIAYMIFTLFPIGIHFLASGISSQVVLGVGMFVLFIIMTNIANRANITSTNAIKTNFENKRQTYLLARKKQTIEKLNQQLQQQALELHEGEERLQGLVNATFEGLIIHENGRIIDTNRSTQEMFGYSEAELKQAEIRQFVTQDDFKKALKYATENYELPYEVTAIHRDGRKFLAEVQGKVVPYQNKMVRVIAIRDLTLRRQAEQQELELKLKQEQIRMLASFFRNASHEFRTPLAVIETALYLIRKKSSVEDAEEKLQQIEQQIQRIDRLVNDLTLLMKIETEIEIDRTDIKLNSILTSITDQIRNTPSEKKITIELALDDNLPMIHANGELMNLAIHAILDNAVRYTKDNGIITIQSYYEANHVNIIIRDTGIGIASDHLPRVFERFYRGDYAHSTAGFGIGLSIVHSIIEQHHGDITITSQLEQGTQVKICLPITPTSSTT